MPDLTFRERMLHAPRHPQADYAPCCIMSFPALRQHCHQDMFELVKAERALGLDSFLFIPVARAGNGSTTQTCVACRFGSPIEI
jgi:hypothetical protein